MVAPCFREILEAMRLITRQRMRAGGLLQRSRPPLTRTALGPCKVRTKTAGRRWRVLRSSKASVRPPNSVQFNDKDITGEYEHRFAGMTEGARSLDTPA